MFLEFLFGFMYTNWHRLKHSYNFNGSDTNCNRRLANERFKMMQIDGYCVLNRTKLEGTRRSTINFFITFILFCLLVSFVRARAHCPFTSNSIENANTNLICMFFKGYERKDSCYWNISTACRTQTFRFVSFLFKFSLWDKERNCTFYRLLYAINTRALMSIKINLIFKEYEWKCNWRRLWLWIRATKFEAVKQIEMYLRANKRQANNKKSK